VLARQSAQLRAAFQKIEYYLPFELEAEAPVSGQGLSSDKPSRLVQSTPPQLSSFWGSLQSGPNRIVKSSRRWIAFSPLEWITFRTLQTRRT
jgi:hypothetical protein